MDEHGCSSIEFYKYTATLEDPIILHGFRVKKTYEDKIKYLIELLVSSKGLFGK